ncbi:hypothetical protein KO494_13255 [Lacinutrix sp. C3R15]|uniref:hypothetical protein n=1 Tax=Flavobacteriaceae TaxID=49546 RepID=UPI001C09156D|nr:MULTISPECIES: hypothetical protein [Flavobacteriaceae]MBU2940509.1 hypothetical protein [Lacinutrix sp. C3R15]MDO6623829.1 hypothetical protein [Oceanihabitans sp. 1_MG-2023]
MIEFLINNRLNILIFVEILAAVTGVLLYGKYKGSAAKYFIYFLVYIVFMAIGGRYTYWVYNDGIFSFLEGTLLESNYWWYTLFWKIAAVVFFGWYYLQVLQNTTSKKILKVSIILFLIISFGTILVTLPDFFKGAIPIISILGALIILQCVFYYFLEILQGDKILTFYRSITFYISCAILLFWLIKTPLVFFDPYYRMADMQYVNLRAGINFFVIYFMYITYTVGLIVAKPEYD